MALFVFLSNLLSTTFKKSHAATSRPRSRAQFQSHLVFLFLMMSVAHSAMSSPAQPIEGTDYLVIPTPQKTRIAGERVEVLEFILFHCIHCAGVDPVVKSWAAVRANSVNMKTIHATFRGTNDPEVRLFYTLEAMEELPTWMPRIFSATQRGGVHLNSEKAVLEWAEQNGFDSGKFQRAWNSSAVVQQTADAPSLVRSYSLSYAPALIVDGKFMTSPALIKKNNPQIPMPMINSALLQVLDFLVLRAKNNDK